MAIYIALLRGINVGGNVLKMDRLRQLCAEAGAQNVQTYVQSGNVVFEAQGSAPGWVALLERSLAGESRLPVSVMVRTAAEMARLAAGNPFLNEQGIDTARLAVTFLQKAPGRAALAALGARDLGRERFHCAGREFYLHCPDGFATAKLYGMDRVLGQKTTTRNWNTVRKLSQMCTA